MGIEFIPTLFVPSCFFKKTLSYMVPQYVIHTAEDVMLECAQSSLNPFNNPQNSPQRVPLQAMSYHIIIEAASSSYHFP